MHVVVEAAVVNEVAAAVAEVVNKQLTFEEEWRLRLIAEGKLKVDTGPQGEHGEFFRTNMNSTEFKRNSPEILPEFRSNS